MPRELSTRRESWPLAAPFRISRGTRLVAEVVVVEIRQGEVRGRGESVPYARYGETPDSVIEMINGVSADIGRGVERNELARIMQPGAARNAIDCALWDLNAKLSGLSVEEQLGLGSLPALQSALTVSLDEPEKMYEAAKALAKAPLIKIKVDATDPAARVKAVRSAAPDARLIVDPNESWTPQILVAMQPTLAQARVDLVEQPLPADNDDALEGLKLSCPVCADESCHTVEDLPKLAGRYQAINIKLDKTGGLTGALELLNAARKADFQIMAGCMVCSSLGIAPAFHIGRHAQFVDLDGPLWLKQDHAFGAHLEAGLLLPPAGSVWGSARIT